MVGELNHRVKNTLATVNSLAEQTLKSSETPEAFAQAFNTRLLVLAKAHDLLTREAWQAVNLSDIAQTVLTAWIEDGRVSIQGAAIRIDPKKALALSMAFNELLTNAIKHGSLSNQVGRVALSWQCQEVCSILWEERGGPPTSEPDRQGFGLRVLNRGLAHELGYPVELRFEPDGLRCTMSMDFSSKQPSGAQ
nr:sensor histidine kinase [Ensifer sp. ENS02]